MSFIERHDLWTGDQRRAAAEVARRVEADGIEVIRLSFPDQHGILRGKSLIADTLPAVMRDGLSITSTLLFKDSSHRTVVPIFTAGAGIGLPDLQGGGDVIMVPDPASFRIPPWLEKTGWMLCDLYHADGRKVPYATRHLYRSMLDRLAERKLGFVAGLEVEFHITRLIDPKLGIDDGGQPGTPPEVGLIHQGYNYLTEQRLDQIEPITDILRRQILALGLPLASIEVEFGPSQVEFVFRAGEGMAPADDMMLFRSAVKQIARRHGFHATFMCRPALPQVMSSGWHLHQSLVGPDGANAFATEEPGERLSPIGRHWLAGLLAAAPEATAFSTPTINGYKRYRTNSLAPDRVAWGNDNRGAMLRVISNGNPTATRIENRIGEPAANPYLYLASQVASGLHGLEKGLMPPPPVDTPYGADAALLPTGLEAALAELDAGTILSAAFGDEFIQYYAMIKRAEIRRYNEYVTDWEMREYFDIF
jgi:glutamine synthetase